jgi:hypothetical protein
MKKTSLMLAIIASMLPVSLALATPAGASTMVGHGTTHPPVLGRHTAIVRARTGSNLAPKPDFTVGNNYVVQNAGGYWLGWNGLFKDQVRTYSAGTDTAYFTPIASQEVDGVWFYQWEINGGPNCLEYDGTTTAVIADTCTSSRASQWWWWDSTDGYDGFYNLYGSGPFMWVSGIANGAPVYGELNEAHNDLDTWYFTAF